jgi:hypothetical protein
MGQVFLWGVFGGIPLLCLLLWIFPPEGSSGASPKTVEEPSTRSRRAIRPGRIATISAAWACFPTQEGLDEFRKWVAAKDSEEILRTLLSHQGQVVKVGQEVKMLDYGFSTHKVRVVETGKECLVPADFVE